jgi:hypothetical protein
VVAILSRSGDMRAMVMPTVTAKNISAALRENVEPSATLMTDEGTHYYRIGMEFAEHQRVKHSLHEYVKGECHVNTAESFFARLKRQLHGTHHSVSPRHLHRYVTEAMFKHNTSHLNDGDRVLAAIHGAEGKRLRYSEPISA